MPRALETILRYTVYGGVFLLPLSVLIVAPGLSFPFITGKHFAFRMIVEVVFAAWLILALYRPNWRPRFSWVAAAIVLFVLVIGFADIFGVNAHRSFWSNFERMDGFISLLHFAALFVVLVSAFSTERVWRRFFAVSFVVSALVSVYGLLQYAGIAPLFQSTARVESVFGNSGFLAAYALLHMFLAAFFAVRSRGARFRVPKISLTIPHWWLYGGVLLLNLSALVLSATRGAIFGATIGTLLAAFLILVFERTSRLARTVSLGLIVFVVTVSGALWFFSDTALVQNSTVLSRVSTVSISKEEQPRLVIWEIALKGFRERPIFGWGQENFTRVFNTHYDPALYSEEAWFDRAHNVVLDWLIAGGVAGLLSYLALFATALAALWRTLPGEYGMRRFSVTEKSIITALLAGYFFQNLFIFDTLGTYLLFFAILAYLVFNAYTPRFGGTKALEKPQYLYPTIAVIVFLLAGTLWTANIKPLYASAALVRATTPQTTPQKNLDAFSEALASSTFGEEEVILELLAVVQAAAQSGSLSEEEKAAFLDFALIHSNAKVRTFRDSARFYLRLGDALAAHGYAEEALISYEKALELSPKKQRTYFQIGIAYLAAGKRDAAKQQLQYAYELAPDFLEARKLYALALIYTEDFAQANVLLSEVPDVKWMFDDRFLDAYTVMQQYEAIVRLWEFRVEKDPENFMTRIGLGVAYALAGDRARGIAEVREAIKLNPAHKEEGERYIEGIRTGRLRG